MTPVEDALLNAKLTVDDLLYFVRRNEMTETIFDTQLVVISRELKRARQEWGNR